MTTPSPRQNNLSTTECLLMLFQRSWWEELAKKNKLIAIPVILTILLFAATTVRGVVIDVFSSLSNLLPKQSLKVEVSNAVFTPSVQSSLEDKRFIANSTPLSEPTQIFRNDEARSVSWCPHCQADVSVQNIVLRVLPNTSEKFIQLWKNIYLLNGRTDFVSLPDEEILMHIRESIINGQLISKILYRARLNHDCEHQHEILQST